MKNRRIACIVLILIFVFASVCFPYTPMAADLKDDDYTNAQNVLKIIIPDFPLSDSEITTRAEFTSAIAKLINVSGQLVTEAPFKDVAIDNIYASDIAYAKGMNIVSNVDLFYPDRPITYAQAIKIAVSAAGYGKKAEYSGGFPSGYMIAAKDAGIGVGLSVDDNALLTHAQAAKLVFETACADMMEVTSFGSSYDYSVTEGKNILSVYHKIYMTEGIVTANEFTGLYNTENDVGEDSLEINRNVFHGAGYNDLIGKNSRIFFKDDAKKSIVYAYELDNEEFIYTRKDDLKLSGLTLSVTPKNSLKSVKHKLAGDYTVIYNGKYLAASDYSSYLNPTAGTVTLINNDGDTDVDIIVIKEISYGIIGSINVFDEKIYDKYKKGGITDLSAMDYYSICESDGTPIGLDTLEAGNVLGFIVSNDEKIAEIIRFSEKKGGIYDSRTSDGKLRIGDTEFEVSSYYLTNVKALEKIVLGSEVIVHLGFDNSVVYIEEYTSTVSYGYVMDIGIQNAGAITEERAVKLLCQNGDKKVISLADKVKVNGTLKTDIDAYSDLAVICTKEDIYKVIKYATNSEGKITKIFDTVMNTEGVSVLTKENIGEARVVLFDNNTKCHEEGEASTGKLFYLNGVFYPYFKAADDAIIMQVPPDGSANIGNDTYYNLSSLDEIQTYTDGASSRNIKCYGYDVDKNGAAFILWTFDSAGSTAVDTSASAIVESVTIGLNPKGENVKVIKMYHNGKWEKYYSKPDSEYVLDASGQNATLNAINAMRPGDIVRIILNSDKEITAARIDFSYATKTVIDGSTASDKLNITGYGSWEVGYASGYVYTQADGMATIIRNMTMDSIVTAANANAIPVGNMFPANLNRGSTLFVKVARNRATGQIESANVYNESDYSSIEGFYSAGTSADYIVQRSRYYFVQLNVIYVN